MTKYSNTVPMTHPCLAAVSWCGFRKAHPSQTSCRTYGRTIRGPEQVLFSALWTYYVLPSSTSAFQDHTRPGSLHRIADLPKSWRVVSHLLFLYTRRWGRDWVGCTQSLYQHHCLSSFCCCSQDIFPTRRLLPVQWKEEIVHGSKAVCLFMLQRHQPPPCEQHTLTGQL